MVNINELISNNIDLSNDELIMGSNISNTYIINDIIKSLKNGGECIIIIPYDIKLYNKDINDYITFRKNILKKCILKEIIYLPIGIFNIDIKLCVLYFIKKLDDNYQTDVIEFYDYNSFNNSKLFLLSISIHDLITNNFSFNYTDYIKETPLTTDNFIIKTLNDIALIEYGNIYNDNDNGNDNDNNNDNDNDNDNDNENDKYKIIGYKEDKQGCKYNREGFNIIITKYKVMITEEKLFINNLSVSVKPKTDIIKHKYLGYYLLYKYKDINLKTLKKFQIAIPPIEVQEEIINFIEINNRIIINLENEINDIKYKSSLWFLNTI
jgi:hypothetical protein